MRRFLSSILPTVITVLVGFTILASFILPAVNPVFNTLINLRTGLVSIAVIIAGWAVVLGFFHLVLGVHIQRIRRGKGVLYSFVLILSAIVTLVFLILDRIGSDPTHPASAFILNNILTPLQSSLGALLAIFLAVAAFRMLRRRRTAGAVWFLLSALIVLLTQIPMPFTVNPDGTTNIVGQVFNGARNLIDSMTVGGLRGLLLGVALGTIATAFRVLIAIDRPQSE